MKEALLYVHVPFCTSKCDYCDFYSVPVCGKPVDPSYVQALLKEETYWRQRYSVSSWKTLYIGGGTPALMPAELTVRLVEGLLCGSQGVPEEITIEVNPEVLTEEKILAYKKCGINRLSMGIQSMNEKALKSVNRHCSAESIKKALSLIDRYWEGKLNLDLIAGLPGQSDAEFEDSVRKTAAFGADHISLYTLTLEEGTPLYKKTAGGTAFDYDRADSQWFAGRDILEEAGYAQYEVSNFAKKNCQGIHNTGYWQQQDYAGLGCSACGTFYDFSSESDVRGIRWSNTRNIDAYVKFWNDFNFNRKETFLPEFIPPVSERELLDSSTSEFEFLMMGLRTLRGVSEKLYEERYSDVEPWHGNLRKRLESVDKIKISGSESERYFHFDRDGLLFLNSALESLL
ncbi:coproporphyrinogen III oxidase family protein [Treponema rectale]|uniref:Heme chaperone HemW n=1 Tax=Treponema rectale TaxID=744512 RepID=A0A840S6L8_9SPIR|nr:radical SAM family heme chaperone HemW [Treponema rectale]MBB5218199.1 oxygen-independent coproporphyrinogen-3 oxidase [Treponema rectale]QOS40096.1 coproporphyrinogen III oxidase family protein [Treponema rectale]